jgi:hypothetical protein
MTENLNFRIEFCESTPDRMGQKQADEIFAPPTIVKLPRLAKMCQQNLTKFVMFNHLDA